MACHVGASTSSGPLVVAGPLEFESLLIQYHSLHKSGLHSLAERLARDVERKGLVPKRTDYLGNSHPQTFKLCYDLWSKLKIPTVAVLMTPNMNTRLTSGTTASALTPDGRSARSPVINRTRILHARELGAKLSEERTFPMEMASTIDRQFRSLGHIDKAYNVQFDRTGRYLFSAADDCIIKCWDLSTGLLRYTFRGTQMVIVDLTISYCNRLMISVSKDDKRVRVWSLQNGEILHVLSMHTGEICGAKFLPIVHPTKRFFFSFGNDCLVNFYSFDDATMEFTSDTFVYNVRTSTGAKIFSGGHSSDGNWASVGDNQGNVFLFPFQKDHYGEQIELKAMPGGEKIDSLDWCHNGPAFAVGSTKSSSGRIWRFLRGNWQYVEFSPELPDDDTMKLFANTKLKYCICQLVWSPDDRFVVASGNDNCVRVYDAFTGKQKHCLAGHANEVYHLHFERIHPSVLLTSAHDGFIFLWDIETGRQLKRIVNDSFGDQNGVLNAVNSAVLDMAISPDGTRFATTDDMGRVTLYGYGSAKLQVPREQFFSSDYQIFSIDAAGFPDVPLHLDPPFKLVDADHVAVPEKWQKLMPAHSDPEKCPWLNQRIIPLLDEAALKYVTESMRAAAQATYDHWDNDTRFALYKSPDDVINIPVAPSRSRNRAHLPTVQELIQQQDARRAEANMEGYRSEDDESYSGSEFSDREELEEDESEHDSDYNQEDARPRQERRDSADPVTTSSGRRVKPRVLDNQENSSPERPRRPNRRVVIDSDDEDLNADNGADVPGTSQQEQSRPVEQKAKKRPKTAKDEFLKSFPKSMQMVKPQKFPYVAQINDSIVYCKQGHAAYIERVEFLKLFPVSSKMKPPAHVGAEVFCIVDDVKYIRKPYRLTVLRLAVINRQNKRTGDVLNIKYHDLEGMPDFLILRHHYDAAMAQGLKEGDEMEAVIDGLWWTGNVVRLQPFEEEYPDSHWNLLQIRWDNGEEETMSPWECQPKTAGRTSNIAATEDQEIALAQCSPQQDDWPGSLSPAANKTAACERLKYAVFELSSLETVQPFAYPVNLSQFETYAALVDYSIDLQTIGERLKSGFYRRLKAFQHDIRYISVAAEQFNLASSTIVYNSRRLVEAIIRFSNDPSIEEDIKKFYDKMYDLDESEIVEYQKKSRLQIDQEVIEMAMASQQYAPGEAGWIRETRTKLTEIFSGNHCKHFLNRTTATDPNVIQVLDELGDLESIKNNLTDYAAPSDVVEAIDGILMACRDAIEDERSRVRDCATQVSNLVKKNMESVVAEYTRIINGDGMRRLRRRAKEHAYETRSVDATREGRTATRRQTGPGFYRSLNEGQGPSSSSALPRVDRATRALRRQIQLAPAVSCSRRISSARSSRASSARASSRQGSAQPSIPEEEEGDEGAEEVPLAEQNGDHDSSSSESSSDSESSEFEPEASERKSAGRSPRAMSEEIKEELEELMEDAEEDLDDSLTRRSKRNPKRRKVSSESEDDAPPKKKKTPARKTGRGRTRNHDSGSSNQENTECRRSLRSNQKRRNYQDSSDEEEEQPKETVSQRGRLRRTTHRYH